MEFLRGTMFVSAVCLMALLVGMGSTFVAFGQVGGSISGRVQDSSGAVVPGTNVTVTSKETGVARVVKTDESGNYQVLSLPVGQYEVKGEQKGFKTQVQAGIDLVVGQQAVVNLNLEVGTTQEQVTVTSDAPLVNTTTSSVAGLVNERQVKDLPLNGRSFDLLITLNPGTSNYTFAKNGSGGSLLAGGNQFTVEGRRPTENLTLLNGVQYSGAGQITDSPGGASGQLLGVDAVREYNVVSGAYGAEFGQRAGGQVTMVTQSGSNQIHGTLFEFLRNSDLDARNFFDQRIGAPPFKRNQFGGALGGPIRKDKTFLFGNYEGFRQRLGLSNVTIVPDLNARQGLMPCGIPGVPCAAGAAAGTPTTVPNFDPRTLALMAFWPLPNGANLGGGLAKNFNNPSQQVREDFGTARFDEILSSKDTFAGVYTISDGTNVSPATDPLFAQEWVIRSQVVSAQETHIFSPQVVNTFTAGYTRAYYNSLSATLFDFPSSLSMVSGQQVGTITFGTSNGGGSLTAPGSSNSINQFVRNLFTYSDGIQIIRGKHQISAGVWFQRIQQNDNLQLNVPGHVIIASLTTMLQGAVTSFTYAPSITPQGWRSWEGAWYVQDSIQLRPNLTVRLGLRHEFSNGWSEVKGIALTPIFIQGVIQTLPRTSSDLLTQNNSKWLFSPRVGLAWDPFGKGKTSIRAAFGTYYDMEDSLSYQADTVPPLNGSTVISNFQYFNLLPINSSVKPPPTCGPGVPTPCTTYGPHGMQSNFKIPTVESWSFSVEQSLTRSTALRAAYVGSHTYHQWVNIDPNTVPPQICTTAGGCASGGVGAAKGVVPQGAQYVPVVPKRPNPFMANGFYAMAAGYGNYDALETEVIQRLARGLQFRANYTWSKNMNIGDAILNMDSGNTASQIEDPFNLRADYGRAGFDQTHQATATVSYELPFGQGKALLSGVHGVTDKLVSGWQLNTIVTLLSGVPVNMMVGSNQSGDGNSGAPDRPNYNPAFTGNIVTGTPNQWFDPKAFSLPTPGTYGNVGRDTLQGPGLASVDLSLFKNTKITERLRLQFRAEFFNALNRANFSFPSNLIFSSGAINPTAGVITATATTSRQIQFGLKLVF